MLDKRGWVRVDADLDAECHCPLAPSETFCIKVLNINAEGMCCSAPMMLKPAQKLSLSLDLKMHGHCDMIVKVVWSGYFEVPGEYRVGLRLAEISKEDQARYLKVYHFLAKSNDPGGSTT